MLVKKIKLVVFLVMFAAGVTAQERIGIPLQSVSEVKEIVPGQRAEAINETQVRRIQATLQNELKDWKLELSTQQLETSTAVFHWSKQDEFIVVSVGFFRSETEAAKGLNFSLMTIQIPRYQAVNDLGDEAYQILRNGQSLAFRKSNLVIHVAGCNASSALIKKISRMIVESVSYER